MLVIRARMTELLRVIQSYRDEVRIEEDQSLVGHIAAFGVVVGGCEVVEECAGTSCHCLRHDQTRNGGGCHGPLRQRNGVTRSVATACSSQDRPTQD